MKHFVITRIGIGIYDNLRLRKMIDLFSIVTLPSLLNQYSKNFYSLIIIDSNIPKECLEHLKSKLFNHSNIHIIPIDVTNLTRVQSGCFDWIWDKCQDFILENNFLDNLNEYIITSILDADDAWHQSVVASIEDLALNNLESLEKSESARTTWIRHSSGLLLTIPSGYALFLHTNKYEAMNFPFHSMAIFVVTRFSSGISACSSRHTKWPAFAEIADFEIAIWSKAPPMWIYSRHNEGVVPWSESNGIHIEDTMKNELKLLFGIDTSLLTDWNNNYVVGQISEYSGKKAAEQYNLIFKITYFNKAISALSDCTSNRDLEIKSLNKKREILISQLKNN